MPLKRLLCILKSHNYVRALIEVNEDRTSKECNQCFHDGNPHMVSNGCSDKKNGWRYKKCDRCNIHWNRDVNAALNIQSVWLHMNDHDGERPINFKRGFKGHNSDEI